MNYCDGAGQAGCVDCDAQHGQCDMCLIKRLESENEAMAKRLLFVDIVHGPKAEMRWTALVNENESLRSALKDAEYRADQGKVWNGMGWTYTGLSSHGQQKVLDILRSAISSPENPSLCS